MHSGKSSDTREAHSEPRIEVVHPALVAVDGHLYSLFRLMALSCHTNEENLRHAHVAEVGQFFED